MNRIDKKLNDEGKLLSIYFTAGYPSLNDTQDIIIKLEESGVDMIEIGLPFSDPLADGPIIQDSSTQAIKNGMNSNVLFEVNDDLCSTICTKQNENEENVQTSMYEFCWDYYDEFKDPPVEYDGPVYIYRERLTGHCYVDNSGLVSFGDNENYLAFGKTFYFFS